jgi:hypothetical protein
MSYRVPSGPLGLLVLLAGSLQVVGAPPPPLLASMAGFWVGPGRIEFDAGASEALLCKAYYATADQANRLSIVLRCASRSQKIELRAKLAAAGSTLTGTWEERTFNARGTATGQVTDGKITLQIDGSGFNATMLVMQDREQQSVSITAQGVGFKAVSVSLSRNAGDQQDRRDAAHE